MKSKHFFLTAFAVAALITASFSNIFSNDDTNLKCYNDAAFKSADSTGNGDCNPGGPINPPIGR